MKKQTFLQWFFHKRLQRESPFERVLVHVVLIFACLIALYPALRVVTISLRPGDRLLSTTLELIPPDASLENYAKVLFEKEKETKNTVRYQEKPEEGKPPVIGTLYVQKWFAGEREKIEIEIAEPEGLEE